LNALFPLGYVVVGCRICRFDLSRLEYLKLELGYNTMNAQLNGG